MSHIIIGGGPAATNAIETIRRFDQSSPITLISDEVAHSRMALPYCLAGQIAREQTLTGDANYFARLNVQTRFGDRVVSINRSERTLSTSAGATLGYDKLLIATGSSPLSLPIEGAQLDGVTPQWSLSDVAKSRSLLDEKTNPRVVLVGAGFIGFIILSALYKRGCQLTVVERESQVLPRMLSGTAASFVHRWLQTKDVNVRCQTSVTAITETSNGSKMVSTSDGAIEADIVVVAAGVQPNTALASEAGLIVEHGIVVNEFMQTSDPNIYSAGDCAQGPAMFNDQNQVHAIHPTAVDHGRIAGANMAGRGVAYSGSLSMNVLDVCGLQCVSYGNWNDSSAESLEINSPDSNVYRSLLWSQSPGAEDQITGAMFVGQANNVGMLTDVGMVKGLMQTETSLGPWKEFLKRNPFDIRRAYIGSGVAAKLAETTLLGQPSQSRGYRFNGAKPATKVTPHHASYVGTKPDRAELE